MVQPSRYVRSALSAKVDKQLMWCFPKNGSCTARRKGRSANTLSLKSIRAVWIHGVVLRKFCGLTGHLSTQIYLEITNESFFSENSIVYKEKNPPLFPFPI